MIYRCFTVHDVKAEEYLPPFMVKARGEAIRMFETSANTPDHAFYTHPEDYTLFYIGEYDGQTGQMQPIASPEPIGKALDFRRKADG